MKKWLSVYIDGEPLESISSDIFVVDILENAPDAQYKTSKNAYASGSHVLGYSRSSLSVTVKLAIRDRDLLTRAAIIEGLYSVLHDAKKLQVSYRPNQHLIGVVSEKPSMSSWKWSEQLEFVFTAYNTPYWQSNTVSRAECGYGIDVSCYIKPDGNELVNIDGVVSFGTLGTWLVISTDNDKFSLQNISIPAGGTVRFGYDDNGYLFITDGEGTSLLNKRTSDSSDNLKCKPRTDNSIRIQSDANVEATFTARGVYV